jgi:ABC-2 type transport system permease protein
MTALRIAWKDLAIAFRDRTALILMLAAPLVLTFGLALISGRIMGSGESAFQHIPVAVVNLDGGDLGNALVDALASTSLNGLLDAQKMQDPAAARALVDGNKTAAAVIVPAGFTDAILGAAYAAVPIEVYSNPEQAISAGIVTAVVESFTQQVIVGRVTGTVTVEQLLAAGLLSTAQAADAGLRVGKGAVQRQEANPLIRLASTEQDVAPAKSFDGMAYFVPSMAIFFLMFTVSWGARSLIAERENGTLDRLASAPILKSSILGGKMLGIYLTAAAQMALLLLANTMFFGVKFGDPVALLVLVAALIAAASGWGMLLAALARTAGQVTTMGSALMLTFGILGGGFLPIANMPYWFQWISKITPNAWGIEGFLALSLGDSLPQIAGRIAVLSAMAAALFAASVWLIGRKGLLKG